MISPPFSSPIDMAGNGLDPKWFAYFSQLNGIVDPGWGTTAQRPTTNLYPGRMWLDESIGPAGTPIFVNKDATGWIFADGTPA